MYILEQVAYASSDGLGESATWLSNLTLDRFTRVAAVRKISGKLKKKSMSGKSQEIFIFSQRNLEKKKKKVGEKSGNFKHFKTKLLLVNMLLEILFSINCKQFLFKSVSINI